MDKYKYGTYHKGYLNGGSNDNLKLIKCEDKIVIRSKLQSYILNWYHMYLLHPGMDRAEATNIQNVYWPGIINDIRKEVINCETFQHKKQSNKKIW